MKRIGDDVYIQRGENFTLDFQVADELGSPFIVLKAWSNPYLAITVTAARYEQEGDMRQTFWLDLDHYYVENENGQLTLQPMKRFYSSKPLYLPRTFSTTDVARYYGSFVDTSDSTKDNYVSNYLFYIDKNADGNREYRYFNGLDRSNNEIWVKYDFRVITSFDTKDWYEQRYLYDMKVLEGQSVNEYLLAVLNSEGQEVYVNTEITPQESITNPNGWSDETVRINIERVLDEEIKETITKLVDQNVPLMMSYETKALLLPPSNLYVSANIQGGV